MDIESTGISPTMFKNLIGKNHQDFSSKSQQDAQEFFLHLVNVLDVSCHVNIFLFEFIN